MRHPEGESREGSRRRGTALVLALWIALLLGIAGVAAMRLAAAGAGGAQVEADLARARAAAEGGLWAAAQRLAQQPREQRRPISGFDIVLGGTVVTVRATDEDGRIDLNAAPEPLLTELFRLAGLPAADAATWAARLAIWREAGAVGGRRHKLWVVTDLEAALGTAPGLAAALREFATTHTGRALPALEAAPPPLRSALARPDGTAPPSRPGLRTPQAQGGGVGRRTLWRVTAEAHTGAVTTRMAAVLDLAPVPGMPGRVLEWWDVAGP